jgi:DNA-binding transcriptional MerR regulator
MDAGITISEAAERSGLSAHTLRYYERIGLVRAPERGTNGHRRYTEEDLAWLGLLIKLRATGMPIADMLRYAELVRQGPGTAAARWELLLGHRAKVAARIAQLQADLAVIDFKIETYYAMETNA